MREGKELKTPRHASAAATRDDYIIIYNIVPTVYKFCLFYNIYIYLYLKPKY